MTPTRPTPQIRNDKADELHGRINVSAEYPDGRKELHALADAALAEERRLVVAEIAARLSEVASSLTNRLPLRDIELALSSVLDESDVAPND